MTAECLELSLSVLEALTGEEFLVGNDGPDEKRVLLVLTDVVPLAHGHGKRPEPFAVRFEGSSSDALGQGTYMFFHPKIGPQPIFIVPVSQEQSTRRYEAIFN